MHALFKEVELGLTDTHLSIHLEHALTSIIEGVIADGLKLKVFTVTAENIERLSLRLLRVALVPRRGGTCLLIVDDLSTAFVEVHVEEDHLLNKKY